MLSAFVIRTKALIGLAPDCDSKNNKLNSDQKSPSNQENSLNMANNNYQNNEDLQGSIFDCIRTIRDPEKPATLEDLQVVYENGIKVSNSTDCRAYIVDIEFNPTVPHCSLATLIGLCMRIKVERTHVQKIKLNIYIKKGAHDTEDDINKQINDKERVAAAMENPNLKEMVEKCINEDD